MTRGTGGATRFALGALLLALAGAGCGGGDDRPEEPAADARQAELRWLELRLSRFEKPPASSACAAA